MDPDLHAHPYSSKFAPLTLEGGQEFGGPLPQDRGDGAGFGGKFQRVPPRVGDANPHGEGPGQECANRCGEGFFPASPRRPIGEGRVGPEDAAERLRGSWHGG
jgi:hypothetical protein